MNIPKGAAGGLIVIFALLAAGTLFSYFSAQSAIRHATATTASVVQLCQAGNEQRAQQRLLWDHVLTISANSHQPHETPAQKRRRLATARAFEAYVHQVFRARDCAAVFH